MRFAGRETNSKGVLDISGYKNLPTSITDSIAFKAGKLNASSPGYTASTPVGGTGAHKWPAQNTTTHTTTYTSYSRDPFFFQRKTDLPHHATLKKMSRLVDKTYEDGYIDSGWAAIPKEDEELKAKTADAADDDDDYTDPYGNQQSWM
jgi:hypothetical protein